MYLKGDNGNYYSILGLYRDTGRGNGNYYSILGWYRDDGKEMETTIISSSTENPAVVSADLTFLAVSMSAAVSVSHLLHIINGHGCLSGNALPHMNPLREP